MRSVENVVINGVIITIVTVDDESFGWVHSTRVYSYDVPRLANDNLVEMILRGSLSYPWFSNNYKQALLNLAETLLGGSFANLLYTIREESISVLSKINWNLRNVLQACTIFKDALELQLTETQLCNYVNDQLET